MPHILLRIADHVRLYPTGQTGDGEDRIRFVEGVSEHFSYAHYSRTPVGDFWYVPSQNDGEVVACVVTQTASEFSDPDYTVNDVEIAPSGLDFSYRASFRIDGHI